MEEKHRLPEGYTGKPGSLEYAAQAADLFNICNQAILGVHFDTPEDLTQEWQTPGFNPESDIIVVFSPDGQLVGYSDLWALMTQPVHPFLWGQVHPEHEGRGIGTVLINWGEKAAERVYSKLPQAARVSIFCEALTKHQSAIQLLEDCGFSNIRYSFQMQIDMKERPPQAVFPQNIQLRTFKMEDARPLFLANDEAFRDHFGFVQQDLEEGYQRFLHNRINGVGFDPAYWLLAMDGDEIAGFSLCRPHAREAEDMGWVSTLAVRRRWRKHGLGLALLLQSFNLYWDKGIRKVGLGVDAENLTGALNLYLKAGMHVHRQTNLYEKEIRPGIELAVTDLK